jgi:hypothetical protein
MTAPVRIPADVDVQDRLVGPFTARQLTILSTTAALLYLLWTFVRPVVPGLVFLAAALPVAVAAVAVAMGQRDGLSVDRLLLAAIRQRLQPSRQVATPDGAIRPAPAWLTTTADENAPTEARGQLAALRWPATGITETGVVDLGADGLAVVAAASTVAFALRTPAEQDALVATFGRYLHSLTAPVQLLVRTCQLDLTGQIDQLRHTAGGLPHPALEAAALEHADYLEQLAEQHQLLRRQVLLVLREPVSSGTPSDNLHRLVGRRLRRGHHAPDPSSTQLAARRAAEARLVRRLNETVDLLAGAGITVTALDAHRTTAVLAAACNPDTLLPPTTELATADEVITLRPTEPDDPPDTTGHDESARR